MNIFSSRKQVDTYGTQQPIALLKLLLEKGGMYDRGKELNFKNFRDIGFLAAMGKVKVQSFFSFYLFYSSISFSRSYSKSLPICLRNLQSIYSYKHTCVSVCEYKAMISVRVLFNY